MLATTRGKYDRELNQQLEMANRYELVERIRDAAGKPWGAESKTLRPKNLLVPVEKAGEDLAKKQPCRKGYSISPTT